MSFLYLSSRKGVVLFGRIGYDDRHWKQRRKSARNIIDLRKRRKKR